MLKKIEVTINNRTYLYYVDISFFDFIDLILEGKDIFKTKEDVIEFLNLKGYDRSKIDSPDKNNLSIRIDTNNKKIGSNTGFIISDWDKINNSVKFSKIHDFIFGIKFSWVILPFEEVCVDIQNLFGDTEGIIIEYVGINIMRDPENTDFPGLFYRQSFGYPTIFNFGIFIIGIP